MEHEQRDVRTRPLLEGTGTRGSVISGERHPGRHFLQIPGPTNIPEAVLQAIAQPLADHRGSEVAGLVREVLIGLRWLTGSDAPVALFPSSGSGACEAALVNTLREGDRILVCEGGTFARRWSGIAEQLGLEVARLETECRYGPDPDRLEARLRDDHDQAIRAVLVVHNETSTGVTADIAAIRAAVDAVGHSAMLFVDTVSSLGSVDYRHDDWRVDVTVGASQKGLMLPPGLAFNVVSERALQASRNIGCRSSYWDWSAVLAANESGFFPYTPATHMLRGLDVALQLLRAEGLDAVFARHALHAGATRAAVEAWGLEIYCANRDAYSNTLTAVMMPDGLSADAVRRVALGELELSLGAGLDELADRVFRIGHLGDLNDLMLAGVISGVELALRRAGFHPLSSGIAAALDYLDSTACV